MGAEASSRHQKEQRRSLTSWREGAPEVEVLQPGLAHLIPPLAPVQHTQAAF